MQAPTRSVHFVPGARAIAFEFAAARNQMRTPLFGAVCTRIGVDFAVRCVPGGSGSGRVEHLCAEREKREKRERGRGRGREHGSEGRERGSCQVRRDVTSAWGGGDVISAAGGRGGRDQSGMTRDWL
eukprot:1993299-Rhodomonas_salina.1